jgi:DNA-binding NarL/FixJ family response regulator
VDRAAVVSVIDDHPDLCYGVLARLPQTGTSFVPGVAAATVPQFLEMDPRARRSDVVLLDLTLKDGSSPGQNVARLKSAGYALVIYTGEERPERLQGSLAIGADALVRKEEAGLLEQALAAVVEGDEAWVSPLMAAIVLEARTSGRAKLAGHVLDHALHQVMSCRRGHHHRTGALAPLHLRGGLPWRYPDVGGKAH